MQRQRLTLVSATVVRHGSVFGVLLGEPILRAHADTTIPSVHRSTTRKPEGAGRVENRWAMTA